MVITAHTTHPKQMTTPYTKATAHRLIPNASKIEAVREYKNCIQCTYIINGRRCSTFLSKKAFVLSNSNGRKVAATAVEITEVHSNQYIVRSKGSYYTVRPQEFNPHDRCECADTYYRGNKCKHQNAVTEYKQGKKEPAAGFGFLPLAGLGIQPTEVYYGGTHWVQIWKLPARYWGLYGHYLVVDTEWSAIVSVVQGSSKKNWEEIKQKREEYLAYITSPVAA